MSKQKLRSACSARSALRGDPRRVMRAKRRSKQKERREEKAAEKRELELLREKARSEDVSKRLAAEPHSFVIHRGKVGRYVRQLENDLRSVMEPFTASKLKELKRNNLKDFLVNGAVLGVTHLVVLTRGEHSLTLRIIRCPQGPTLSFRIMRYTLARDVVSSLRRPVHFRQQFVTAPLVVMNGLSNASKKQIQLMQSMFQNMFPSINVDKMKLSQVRRCVMINYDAENDVIDLRHYAIKAVPAGLSKGAKKLVQGKVPDLSKYKDISDFFLNPGQLSESEFEGEQKEVELAQDLSSRGCRAGQRTNIRLIELGPRVTMTLTKIEEGVDEGEVLYHSYIRKSAEELVELRTELLDRKKLKERRRKENERRVIQRLKAIADERAAWERSFEQERQKIIDRQRAVTGEEDDGRSERRDRLLNNQRLNDGGGGGQNEPAMKKVQPLKENTGKTRPEGRHNVVGTRKSKTKVRKEHTTE